MRVLARFAASKRGGIPMFTIMLMIPTIAAVGFAVDLTRVLLVKSRLQTAVDAAALVAGREINTSNYTTDATALFWANFSKSGTSTDPKNPGFVGYLGAVGSDPTYNQVNADTVMVSASATLDTTLLKIVGTGMSTVSRPRPG